MSHEEKIDKLVKDTLNPYLIFKINVLNSLEEYEKLKQYAEDNIITDEFDKAFDFNCLELEITWDSCYIFIRQNFLDEFLDMTRKCGYKYTLTDAVKDFWEVDDMDKLIKKTKEDKEIEEISRFLPGLVPDKVEMIEVLKQVVEEKYTKDDVLDKINQSGIESLNELNKYILEK